MADENSDKLLIFPSLKNYPRPVYTTNERCFKVILENGIREMTDTNLNCLEPHNVLTGFDTKAIYTKVYFRKHTALEIFLDSEVGSFEIVGNPIVGRYKYEYESLSWNITACAVVYASGLKIQWGNFNPLAASGDETKGTYFPVKFEDTPSMSFTFKADSNHTDHTVYYQDFPYAVSKSKWKFNEGADNNGGTWIAIGY